MSKLVSTILAAGLLALGSPLHAEQAPPPTACAKLQGTELPLEQTMFGYVVPVKVAGVERHFLLDLTQPFSIIDENIANGLKVESQKLPNGFQIFFAFQNLSKYGTVPEVEFAGLKFPPTEFVLWKKNPFGNAATGANNQDFKMPEIDGAIGINVLARLDFELDLKNKKLRLYLPNHCPFTPEWESGPAASTVFQIDANWNALSIPAVLDGKPVQIALDLGAKETTMLGFRASKIFGFDVFTSDLTALPRDSGQENMPRQFSTTRRQYPFKSLAAGPLAINNPKIAILGPLGRVCNDSHSADFEFICYRRDMGDVVIGANILANLHLYFSQSDKKLYFASYASQPAAPAPK